MVNYSSQRLLNACSLMFFFRWFCFRLVSRPAFGADCGPKWFLRSCVHYSLVVLFLRAFFASLSLGGGKPHDFIKER